MKKPNRRNRTRKGKSTKKCQVSDSILELVTSLGAARETLLDLVCDIGLKAILAMMEEDRDRMVGGKYRHNPDRQFNCYGYAPGSMVLNGGRVKVLRPRIRSTGGRDIMVPTYQEFRNKDEVLDDRTVAQIICGVPMRKYRRSLETGGTKQPIFSASKSAVSRRFIAKSWAMYDAWNKRSLEGLDLIAIMIDGVELGDYLLIFALGIDLQGDKHALGLIGGTTENAGVCKKLLSDMVERGIPADRKMLFVIDGSKGIRKAINKVFYPNAVVQRCQKHKVKNVLNHLSEHLHVSVKKAMWEAYDSNDTDTARRLLKNLENRLKHDYPSAVGSLKEGLEETLTMIKLGVPKLLKRSLSMTNLIESVFSGVRTVNKNVKRWRNERMALRWAYTGITEVEKHFNKIKGARYITKLLSALNEYDISEKKLDKEKEAA